MTLRQATLSNGIRLVTEARETEAVALHIYFGCGGRHEPDEVVGVSHALEHMIFKGTPTRTHFQIAQEMEGVGASINANTGGRADLLSLFWPRLRWSPRSWRSTLMP